MPVITFNDILGSAGVDPGTVVLARHQDARAPGGSLYEIWQGPGGQAIVEEYQAIQKSRPFKSVEFGGFVASFVVPPLGKEALFIGLYAVRGLRPCQAGQSDPITREDVTGYNFYELDLDDRLNECRGHLFVDWGRGARQWWQHAVRNPKSVLAAPPAALAILADPVDVDDVEATGTEGGLLLLQHRARERDARLRQRKTDAARRDGRTLVCETCGFDFEDT